MKPSLRALRSAVVGLAPTLGFLLLLFLLGLERAR